MTNHESLLRSAERRLQLAQLRSDVAELDALVDERLIFTGPDGRLYGKQDDLDVHGQGRQVMSKVEQHDLRVIVAGQLGVTCFYGRLEGVLDGEPFAAQLRYTRTWVFDEDRGWQLVAGHASIV
ncbi:MAG TPA: nuclear transport factor 2 family protein [Propionibacteriaceae bacterium]|nr:nuclear transport factor 2 family protein [Propionibacteriaceae bacterium]